MKFRILLCLFFCFILSNSQSFSQKLKTKIDSVSYAAGISFAENLKTQGILDLDIDILAQAMKEVLSSKKGKILIQPDSANVIFNQYLRYMLSKEGKEWLAANAKKPGVITLESGLQYEVIKKGSGGPKPTVSDKVKSHYHGTLIDSTIFDSSIDRGEPITFGLDQVIVGWVEGIQLMSVGDKYKFFIPYELGYGEGGVGNIIAPFSTLIFEVELLGINE